MEDTPKQRYWTCKLPMALFSLGICCPCSDYDSNTLSWLQAFFCCRWKHSFRAIKEEARWFKWRLWVTRVPSGPSALRHETLWQSTFPTTMSPCASATNLQGENNTNISLFNCNDCTRFLHCAFSLQFSSSSSSMPPFFRLFLFLLPSFSPLLPFQSLHALLCSVYIFSTFCIHKSDATDFFRI